MTYYSEFDPQVAAEFIAAYLELNDLRRAPC